MGKQVVLEVTQPFHATGTEVMHQPGEQFPLDADVPAGMVVREVIADVPDAPAKPKPKSEPEPEPKPSGKPSGGKGT